MALNKKKADGESSHDPGSSTSHLISYEHANHAGIVARTELDRKSLVSKNRPHPV